MISNSPPLSQELQAGSVKWLSTTNLETIFESFELSFANYPIPFNLNKKQFHDKFYTRLNMDKSLSPGFFINNKLLAFIFTSIRIFNKKNVAYNGGTGVVPEGRGYGLVYKLYEELIPKLVSLDINKSILEVLENNKRAIHVYEQCGYKKNRFLKSFLLSPMDLDFKEMKEDIIIQESDDLIIVESWWDKSPGCLESSYIPQFDKIFVAQFEQRTIGYIIFNPSNGRISQIAVAPTYRRQGIGSNLIRIAYNNCSVKKLTVLNVDSENKSLISLLMFARFSSYINQYEMALSF